MAVLLLTLVTIPLACTFLAVPNTEKSLEDIDSNPKTSYSYDYIPSTSISSPFELDIDTTHMDYYDEFDATYSQTYYHEADLDYYTPYIFYIAGGPVTSSYIYMDIYIEGYYSNTSLYSDFIYSGNKFLFLVEVTSSSTVHFDITYEGSSTTFYNFYGIGIYSLSYENWYYESVEENDFDFRSDVPNYYTFTAGQYYFSSSDYYERASYNSYDELYYVSYTSMQQGQILNDYDNWFTDGEYLSSGSYIFFDLYSEDIDFQYETTTPYTPPSFPFPVISFGPFFILFGLLGVVMVTILAKKRIQKHEFD